MWRVSGITDVLQSNGCAYPRFRAAPQPIALEKRTQICTPCRTRTNTRKRHLPARKPSSTIPPQKGRRAHTDFHMICRFSLTLAGPQITPEPKTNGLRICLCHSRVNLATFPSCETTINKRRCASPPRSLANFPFPLVFRITTQPMSVISCEVANLGVYRKRSA